MIGLDVGDRRIGVAAADGLGLTAQGLTTLIRGQLGDDLRRLAGLIQERRADRLVVGLPKNMNGSLGPQGEKVKGFVAALLRYLAGAGLPAPEVIYWDERLTTVAARRTLLEADVSRRKRKEVVDKLAAVLILQGYLDRQAWAARRSAEAGELGDEPGMVDEPADGPGPGDEPADGPGPGDEPADGPGRPGR
jgi:putative Holliday junction resolvase